MMQDGSPPADAMRVEEVGGSPARRTEVDDDADGEGTETAVSRWVHRITQPLVLFPLLGVVALAVLAVGTAGLIRVEEESVRSAARSSAAEHLETYEAQVVRVMREIDQTLKTVQYAYAEVGDGTAALAELDRRDLLPPDLVFRVTVVDGEGDVRASTGGAEDGSVGGRDFLRRVLTSDSLVVSRPVEARDGDWRLRFGRRLTSPDGTARAALVEVDASFFVSGYETSQLGERGVLGVLGVDGVFRARRSGDRVTAGGRADYATLVGDPEATGDVEVDLETNGWDGVRRYTAARGLFGYPLAVVVGLSRAEQMAPAAERGEAYIRRAAAGGVLVVLVLSILGRMSWKLEEVRRRESEARMAHARRAEHMALHDGLTGLPNRTLLSRLLEDSVSRARRYDRNVAVLFLDLDGFKKVNDTLGHEAGDQLLREVARRLESSVRESDTVARVGGDEFVVLLPEVEARGHAATVAEKVVAALREPFDLLGQEFRVTTSVGVSVFPGDGEDEQTLLKNADIAMYRAKERGKDGVRFFSEEMSRRTRQRLLLESSLREALENEEFDLHYQARREVRTGGITGMEALIRWRHPELGTVEPMKFLPLAEEMGLIVPIGRWVLKTACEQGVAWQAQGLPRLNMAVNLSARQFFDEGLVADVRATLEETGLAPELLELEVSESVVVRDASRTLPILKALKELGVRITIDNFGTGYSTLSVLRKFPLDSIKVDRRFIRESGSDRVEREVTDAILAMGRTLSPSLVAQGVETREQADYLREHACDEVQGFYFNRPVSAEDVGELLRTEGVGAG